VIGTAITAVIAQQNREHWSWHRTWGQGRGRMKLLVFVIIVHEYDGPWCVYAGCGVGCTVDINVDVEGKRKLGEAGNQSVRADTWL